MLALAAARSGLAGALDGGVALIVRSVTGGVAEHPVRTTNTTPVARKARMVDWSFANVACASRRHRAPRPGMLAIANAVKPILSAFGRGASRDRLAGAQGHSSGRSRKRSLIP